MTARRELRVPPAIMRLGLRQVGRRSLDPALPWPVQRTWRMWHDFALQPGLLAAADSALAQASWFVRKVTASR